jgi:hypothetical protein
MKGGYMPGHIPADTCQKLGDVLQNLLRVIVARDDKGGDLNPDPLLPELLDIMLDRLQPGGADLPVELIVPLEVDVDGVDQWDNPLPGLLPHVAVADKDALEPRLPGGSRHIQSILQEDCRLGVGAGYG